MQKQYDIEIYALAYGGQGIGRLNGKICFVDGALPGEKASFIIQSEKKSFISGTVKDVLKPSVDRVKPACPYYGKCGGCQYQHLNYEKEVFYKAEQVNDILGRMGGLKEYDFQGVRASVPEYGYRTSITLHRSANGYGYFAKDNKTVIAIKHCPLAVKGINNAISTLVVSGGKKDATIKCNSSGNVYISNYPGHRFYKDEFLGTELTFSPLAFSQANRQIAISMAEQLRAWMQEEKRGTLFDLYCGVGFFGLLMRDLFESIIGIDNSSIAIDCAQATKKLLAAANIKFYCADAEEKLPFYYEKLHGKINTILIDPPRSGINAAFAAHLRELEGTHSLYYISCDPAILARDARLLTQSGTWRIERVGCFDMFPRTKHIETIALFKR